MLKCIIVGWNTVFVVIVNGLWRLQCKYSTGEIKHSKPNCQRRIFRWVQKLRWVLGYFLECAIYEDEGISPKGMSWMSCGCISVSDFCDLLLATDESLFSPLCVLSLHHDIPFRRWAGWSIHRSEFSRKDIPRLGAACSFWGHSGLEQQSRSRYCVCAGFISSVPPCLLQQLKSVNDAPCETASPWNLRVLLCSRSPGLIPPQHLNL